MSPKAGYFLLNEVAPCLYAAVHRNVKAYGAEDSAELRQDAIAMAAQMVDRLEQRSKEVTARNVVYYVVKNLRAGRRSTGTSVVDAMASGTQARMRSGVSSLDARLGVNAEDENDEERLALLESGKDDPATIAARNLDWEELLKKLTRRERLVVGALIAGNELQGVAVQAGAARSSISADKLKIAALIKAEWGADIITQIASPPCWRNSVIAARAKRTRGGLILNQ